LHVRHLITAGLLWVVLTAVGELLVVADLYPTVGSDEAQDFDDIFRFLLLLGVPVMTFVFATLIYAGLQFRIRTAVPTEDGPVMHGHGWFPRVWLAVTGSLAIFVMIFPGLTGLAKLQQGDKGVSGWGDQDAEIVIKATAFKWQWLFEYPDGTQVSIATGKELVLPNDTSIRFNVNSLDVVHSLWIPAFRMKIDGIPGRTTFMTVRPTQLGEYQDDQAYRVQCAELCGLDHSTMMFPIRVVEPEEFERWLASLNEGGN
jgi:cytochrome c oxidase subunit 2